MRQVTDTVSTCPSARVMRKLRSCCGFRLGPRPTTSNVSVPSSLSVCALAPFAGVAPCHPPLRAGDHKVLDPHVGKGPTCHHSVVATPRAVAVEVLDRNPLFSEVPASRRSLLDAAGG